MTNFLAGYRTYLLGAAGLVTIVLFMLKVIDADVANILLGIEGFGSIITLRAALKSL